MLILILFAFIAGIVTILSPCILPILPIVLSGSLTGGKKRPLGIVAGFIVSFTFFTLALSALVKATGINADSLRFISIVSIGLFGVSLLIPRTQVLLEMLFSRLSRFIPNSSPTAQNSGFGGGVVIGLSLGLLWTPCVGPILASVITLALSGSTSASAFFITLAYAFGTGLPMLAITYGGRELLHKVPWVLSNTARIQKGFGVIMIAMAVALYFNIDRKIQTIVLTTFPNYGTGLTSIENNARVQEELQKISPGKPRVTQNGLMLSDLGAVPDPTFSGATGWVNSEPLSFEGNLKGKVVLVDFWTYSCINCIRTFPYLKDWYEKYKDKGFVIVGVHSPEFEFEKNEKNVLMAMDDFGITYPVVQDNDFLIWRAYSNQYWPAHYLVDSRGHIRYTHFGEGKYAETEKNIQTLLQEASDQASLPEITTTDEPQRVQLRLGDRQTPEIYLGSQRAENYTQRMSPAISSQPTTYTSAEVGKDEVGLNGVWTIEEERITSGSDTGTLSLNFFAANVYLVLGGKNEQNLPVTVSVDGKPVGVEMRTQDYDSSGGIRITQDRKYDIIATHGPAARHTVELTIPTGISAYAFTFGE